MNDMQGCLSAGWRSILTSERTVVMDTDGNEPMDFIQARETLTDAGMEHDVAEATIRTVNGVVVAKAATKLDLERTANRLDNRITDVSTRLDQRITDEANRLDQRITDEANRLDQRITDEANRLDLSIRGLDGKIDTKVAELRTDIEKVRTEVEKVRTEVERIGNRSTRNLGIQIGVLVAVLAFFETVLPLLQSAGP